MIKQILRGHISPETAYIIPDYPYGFTLRCQKRIWIETNRKGSRLIEQTSNPKKGNVWNKPKASIYSAFMLMYLDEKNHVHNDGLCTFTPSNWCKRFVKDFWQLMNEEEKRLVRIEWHKSCLFNYPKKDNPEYLPENLEKWANETSDTLQNA